MASASPSASMTVVLEVGARFSGQASCSILTSRTMCEFWARVEFGSPQTAMILHLEPRDGGQDSQHLFGLAAGAQGQDDVAIRDHAEIAVQGVQGIEHDGRRAGAGEGGGDLVPDMPGFAHAEDDDFAARFHAFFDQLDGARKIVVQPVAQTLELEDFDIENASGFFEIIHRALIVRRSVGAGKDS